MKSYKEHEYWIYVMASITGTVYVGITGSLFVRVGQHKAGEIEGFSKTYHCTRLVYYESYDDVRKALKREKQLKGWRRSKKTTLIEKKNPWWQDLAETWGRAMLFKGQSMQEAEEQEQRRIKF